MKTVRRNVLLLSASQALTMTANVILLSTAGLVGAALAPTESLATLPIALQFVAVMATTFPAAFLMRRVGRRPGFVAGALVGAVGGGVAVAAVIAGSFVGFIVGGMLFGVSNGFATYYRFAAVDVAPPEYQSRAVAYVLAGGVVAAVAGPTLASRARLSLSDAEFAGSLLVLVVLMVAAAAVCAFLTIPKPRMEERVLPGRPLRRIARQPTFAVAVIAAVLGYGVMVLLMNATPLAMREEMFSFGQTAVVIQWHVLGMFAPSFFSGALIRRFGELPVMLAGGLLTALCIAINVGGGSVLSAYWVALFLLGVGWNFLFVGGTTLLTAAYRPEEKAKTQAFNDLLIFAATALASLSAGALVYGIGWSGVNVAAVPVVALIIAAVLWLMAVPGGPEPAAHSGVRSRTPGRTRR